MIEKQWWIEKIQELTDEIGTTDVVLNRYTEADDKIGYYFNKETGKFDVYKTMERDLPTIYASTENEIDALKEVYDLVNFEAEKQRRDLRRRSGIKVRSADLRTKIMQNITVDDKNICHISKPVLHEQNGSYYVAVFLTAYSEEEKGEGYASRPFEWVLADLATGDIVKQYQCKENDFTNASFDKQYNICLEGEHDVSKEYYYRTDGFFDYVRAGILMNKGVLSNIYSAYMNRILANIPVDYQRFYWGLSI